MIRIRFHPRQRPQSIEPRAYWIAGRSVITDVPIRELAAFKTWRPIPDFGMPPDIVFERPGRQEQETTVDTWIGDRLQRVVCRRSTDGYLISVAELGRFYIDESGREIIVMDTGKEGTPPGIEVIQIVLGPAIALALALQEVWCLWCSVIQSAGTAVVFLGGHNTGKSTLAKGLIDNGWAERLVADDVLPVEMREGKIDCLPHFPQLRLGLEKQFGQGNRDRMAVDRLCVLEVRKRENSHRVSVQSLSPQRAVELLVEHTMGIELFGPALLDRHLAFCSRVVSQTEVLNIQHPLGPDSVPLIGEKLRQFCRV